MKDGWINSIVKINIQNRYILYIDNLMYGWIDGSIRLSRSEDQYSIDLYRYNIYIIPRVLFIHYSSIIFYRIPGSIIVPLYIYPNRQGVQVRSSSFLYTDLTKWNGSSQPHKATDLFLYTDLKFQNRDFPY
jgi:hypothetical protein